MKMSTLLCDECDTCKPVSNWVDCDCGGMLDYITVEINLQATWHHYKDKNTLSNWILNKQGFTIPPPITWTHHG